MELKKYIFICLDFLAVILNTLMAKSMLIESVLTTINYFVSMKTTTLNLLCNFIDIKSSHNLFVYYPFECITSRLCNDNGL